MARDLLLAAAVYAFLFAVLAGTYPEETMSVLVAVKCVSEFPFCALCQFYYQTVLDADAFFGPVLDPKTIEPMRCTKEYLQSWNMSKVCTPYFSQLARDD
jgi:hypothetical protein